LEEIKKAKYCDPKNVYFKGNIFLEHSISLKISGVWFFNSDGRILTRNFHYWGKDISFTFFLLKIKNEYIGNVFLFFSNVGSH